MSSTGRLTSRVRHDVYPTEEVLARVLIQRLVDDGHISQHVGICIEPSAGGGAFVRPLAAIAQPQRLIAVELRTVQIPEASEVVRDDFLAVTTAADLICGNPPYEVAQRHIEHGLSLLTQRGTLAFLLRLAFLECKDRVEFWQAHPPAHIYSLVERPSFKKSTSFHVQRLNGKKWERVLTRKSETQANTDASELGASAPTARYRVVKSTSSTDSAAYGFFVWHKHGGRWPAHIEPLSWKS